MIELSEDEFISMCERAMRLGWRDGTRLTMPRTSRAVADLILPQPRAVMHRRKMRQVYGAAFDVSRAQHPRTITMGPLR